MDHSGRGLCLHRHGVRHDFRWPDLCHPRSKNRGSLGPCNRLWPLADLRWRCDNGLSSAHLDSLHWAWLFVQRTPHVNHPLCCRKHDRKVLWAQLCRRNAGLRNRANDLTAGRWLHRGSNRVLHASVLARRTHEQYWFTRRATIASRSAVIKRFCRNWGRNPFPAKTTRHQSQFRQGIRRGVNMRRKPARAVFILKILLTDFCDNRNRLP